MLKMRHVYILSLLSTIHVNCGFIILEPTGSRFSRSRISDVRKMSKPHSRTSTRLFGKRGNDKVKKDRVSKTNLPEKVCVVCDRPFTWRKKWERCWDEVTCCSKSCNAKRRGAGGDDVFVKYGN